MPSMNILDLQPENLTTPARSPELIRLGNDEEALIPFTSDVESVDLHYLDNPAIKNYIHCNGADCVLCQIGKNVSKKLLLPVFRPVAKLVGILPMSDNMKPGALAPQLIRQLKDLSIAGRRSVVFIKKLDLYSFTVQSTPIPQHVDDGASQIKEFEELLSSGKFNLASVYPTHTNEQLKLFDDIREQLKLRGMV